MVLVQQDKRLLLVCMLPAMSSQSLISLLSRSAHAAVAAARVQTRSPTTSVADLNHSAALVEPADLLALGEAGSVPTLSIAAITFAVAV
jgi:hypothetical protein